MMLKEAMDQSARRDGEIHQHSGWLIPLALFAAIGALCALFLLYYLRPASLRDNRPSGAITATVLRVRGLTLHIPANYLESRAPRRGDQDVVALFALLPDMRGFSAAEAPLFQDNGADSPVVHLLIRADTNSMDSGTRLARIYMPYISNPNGNAADFGLTRYSLRADSGYGRSDLFMGKAEGGMRLFLCERPAQDVPSPNCLAIDRPIAASVNLSYRFKRAQLARWRQISEGAARLVAGFQR